MLKLFRLDDRQENPESFQQNSFLFIFVLKKANEILRRCLIF